MWYNGYKQIGIRRGEYMKFNDCWKIPRDAKQYFSPKYEKKLKEKYGMWYTLHTVLSILIAFLPLVLFFIISPSNAFEPSTQIGNIIGGLGGIIGVIGSVIVGVGLVNIFMALVKQYLGHWVTIITIIGGTILDLLALLLFSFVR